MKIRVFVSYRNLLHEIRIIPLKEFIAQAQDFSQSNENLQNIAFITFIIDLLKKDNMTHDNFQKIYDKTQNNK